MKLSTHSATTSMIATIHTLKSRAGLDDDTYRDLLFRETGYRSAKELSVTLAGRVIEKLREVAGDAGVRGAIPGLDSPVGGKLRALWIAGFDLGIVTDRTDRAMLAFLQRQTRVSHTRFLTHPAAATSAIEGLKSWLTRSAGVDWPTNSDDVIGSKRAVLNAQWARLLALGQVETCGTAVDPMLHLRTYACRVARRNSWEGFESHNYDEVQKALGRKLRSALARRSGELS